MSTERAKSFVRCPGCGEELTTIEETTDHVNIMQWGGRRKPIREIEVTTLYCPLCERILAEWDLDVTPASSEVQ